MGAPSVKHSTARSSQPALWEREDVPKGKALDLHLLGRLAPFLKGQWGLLAEQFEIEILFAHRIDDVQTRTELRARSGHMLFGEVEVIERFGDHAGALLGAGRRVRCGAQPVDEALYRREQ